MDFEVKEQEILQAPVLIVDDSLVELRKLKQILESTGFANVHTCVNPENVYDKYSEIEPFLTVLDHYMPEMTGVEVLEQLADKYPRTRVNVLFWTSASRSELYNKALDKGARDLLRKENVRDEEIVARVKNLIETQLYYNRLRERNEQLNTKVSRRTEELRRSTLETIGRLSRAAEFRDDETGGHIQRIGQLAGVLARSLGMDAANEKAISYAAPMHDVGKIGVSDEILFKPGSLTDSEWDEMKKHTVYGASILSDASQHHLQLSRNIALYHHENWDGSGYPEGLVEDEIPIEARITAVCDVFDAVLSDRPYRTSTWSVEDAFDLIRSERGEQFDPEVAECFLDNADRMVEVRKLVEAGESEELPFRLESEVITETSSLDVVEATG